MLEAIAIAVPDAYRGQAAKLFVTLRPDQRSHARSHPAILERTSEQDRNAAREIEIRDTLPKTMVGKLSKKELVAEEVGKAAGRVHNLELTRNLLGQPAVIDYTP